MSADVTAVRASIGTQTQDDPFLTRFSQISTGPEYTLALDQDGHIWSWGRNDSYQLGDGTNVDRAVLARIDPDPERPNLRFVQVQAADTRGMALDENGVLPERAWLAAMPHTGLGTWTIICLGAGLLALLAGAGVLLRRR